MNMQTALATGNNRERAVATEVVPTAAAAPGPSTPDFAKGAPVVVGEWPDVFVTTPGQFAAGPLEDLWERYGVRQLWVVALAGTDRAAEVLSTAALGHRPVLVWPSTRAADDARQTIMDTVVRMRHGDVLLVVADDVAAVIAWMVAGARWRWQTTEVD